MADLLLSVGASFLKYMRISSDDVKQGKNGMVLLSATTVVGVGTEQI